MFLLAAGDDPTSHVRDVVLIGTKDFPILTMHMVTLIVAAGIVLWIMHTAAKAIATGPASQGNDRYVTSGRIGQLIEAMILYLRDQMLEPVLGERATRTYTPFLLSVFFFVLVNNVLGLVPFVDVQHLLHLDKLFGGATPFGGTATGNISITAGLAVIAGIMIVVHGIRDLGLKGFVMHLFGGLLPCPPSQALLLSPVLAIVFVIEFLGLIIKPTALAIRLFANMVAGHTLLAVLLSFGLMAAKGGMGLLGVSGVVGVTGIAAMLIMLLETFVAFLQAFIFMFLTAVFISLFTHHDEHEHEHAHDDGHGHAHGEARPHAA